MPQHSHYIATKSPSPDVFVYDRSLHPAKPVAPAGAAVGAALVPTPDIRLVGHDKEGYGLSWSPREAGHLLSGAEDHLICFWDLQSSLSPASSVLAVTHPTLPASHSGAPTKVLAAAHTYRGHSDIVEDVQWNPHQDGLFASAGDDKLVILWDRRQKETHVVQKVRALFICHFPSHRAQASSVLLFSLSQSGRMQMLTHLDSFMCCSFVCLFQIEAHAGEVNCLSYNPFKEHLLVTGSSDRTLALWDLRNTSSKLHSFEAHLDQVTGVEWAPFSETVLASTSADRRVCLWDMTRIGAEQEPEDAEDGPPELLFQHGGHTDKVRFETTHTWRWALVLSLLR
jgi:WD40 repeat protein